MSAPLGLGHCERRPKPPTEPEPRGIQRARVVLQFTERDELHHSAENGWARLEGPWLHFLNDASDRWEAWPMANVVCVEWTEVDPDVAAQF